MTQYCYFHTPATNGKLKSNCSVCGVVAVRIFFSNKSSIAQMKCLTALLNIVTFRK